MERLSDQVIETPKVERSSLEVERLKPAVGLNLTESQIAPVPGLVVGSPLQYRERLLYS